MSGGVKDLKLWQEAVALAGEALRTVKQHSRRETRAFNDRLTMEAAAIPAEIGEGYRKRSASEQLPHFEQASKALAALEADIAIIQVAGAFPEAAVATLAQRATIVGRLLHGYLSYVERQVRQEGEINRSEAALPAAAGEATDQVHSP